MVVSVGKTFQRELLSKKSSSKYGEAKNWSLKLLLFLQKFNNLIGIISTRFSHLSHPPRKRLHLIRTPSKHLPFSTGDLPNSKRYPPLSLSDPTSHCASAETVCAREMSEESRNHKHVDVQMLFAPLRWLIIT